MKVAGLDNLEMEKFLLKTSQLEKILELKKLCFCYKDPKCKAIFNFEQADLEKRMNKISDEIEKTTEMLTVIERRKLIFKSTFRM